MIQGVPAARLCGHLQASSETLDKRLAASAISDSSIPGSHVWRPSRPVLLGVSGQLQQLDAPLRQQILPISVRL